MTETRGTTKPAKRTAEEKSGEYVPRGVLRSFASAPAVFYRECVAELRKVVWPTGREVVTYTTVVLVFVLVLIGIVTGLDLLLGKGVLRIFS